MSGVSPYWEDNNHEIGLLKTYNDSNIDVLLTIDDALHCIIHQCMNHSMYL